MAARSGQRPNEVLGRKPGDSQLEGGPSFSDRMTGKLSEHEITSHPSKDDHYSNDKHNAAFEDTVTGSEVLVAVESSSGIGDIYDSSSLQGSDWQAQVIRMEEHVSLPDSRGRISGPRDIARSSSKNAIAASKFMADKRNPEHNQNPSQVKSSERPEGSERLELSENLKVESEVDDGDSSAQPRAAEQPVSYSEPGANPTEISAKAAYVLNERSQYDVPYEEPEMTKLERVTKKLTTIVGVSGSGTSTYERSIREDLKRTKAKLAEVQNASEMAHGEMIRLHELAERLQAERDEARQSWASISFLIRKQQEDDFKGMESGVWLPTEESRVKGDLIRIKTALARWSKQVAIADISYLDTIQDRSGFKEELSHVMILENDALPSGLKTKKGASLILSALVAHDLFTKVFASPFFFLDDGLEEKVRIPTQKLFVNLYQAMECVDEPEAHIWRSQTLRLLQPPPRQNSQPAELFEITTKEVNRVSNLYAGNFLKGPAHHIMALTEAHTQELSKIYQQGATLSYQLWTRRTVLRCYTLKEMGRPVFDLDSEGMEPHGLVRYDEHEDNLHGKPISVIVHPLLKAFGTDEAKNYDKSRVWAPAVVWLDSSTSI